jgi:hypothetical protein
MDTEKKKWKNSIAGNDTWNTPAPPRPPPLLPRSLDRAGARSGDPTERARAMYARWCNTIVDAPTSDEKKPRVVVRSVLVREDIRIRRWDGDF